MNYKKLAKRFWQQGFLHFEGFFDEALMDEYNELILQHFGETPEFFHNQEFLEKSQTEVIPWFPQKEGVKVFDKVEDDPRLNHLSAAILGDGWNSQYSMVMFSRQGSKGQAWHQDCPPDNPAAFNMNRLVYTMDITDDIGGYTMAVRGSHKRGLLPVSEHDCSFAGEVTFKPQKGDLILLHGHCWHRVLPVTGKYRVSTNYRSAPKGTDPEITNICVYGNMRYQFSTNSVIEDRHSG